MMDKKSLILNLVVIGLLGTLTTHTAKAISEVMTFEEAFEITKHAPVRLYELRKAEGLKPRSDRWLTEDSQRTDWLLESSDHFKSLYSLDFTRQDIDDAFIERLAEKGFERVRKINLQGNQRITARALQLILDSDSLGSLKELLEHSVRYTALSAKIKIKVGGTSIAPHEIAFFNDKARFDFGIDYRTPDGVMRHPSVIGIKELKVVKDFVSSSRRGINQGLTGYIGVSSGPIYMTGPTGPMYMTGPTGTPYVGAWIPLQ